MIEGTLGTNRKTSSYPNQLGLRPPVGMIPAGLPMRDLPRRTRNLATVGSLDITVSFFVAHLPPIANLQDRC